MQVVSTARIDRGARADTARARLVESCRGHIAWLSARDGSIAGKAAIEAQLIAHRAVRPE